MGNPLKRGCGLICADSVNKALSEVCECPLITLRLSCRDNYLPYEFWLLPPSQINLYTHTVTTITGTGCQGTDKEGGEVGVSQEINSPWDLQLGTSPGERGREVISRRAKLIPYACLVFVLTETHMKAQKLISFLHLVLTFTLHYIHHNKRSIGSPISHLTFVFYSRQRPSQPPIHCNGGNPSDLGAFSGGGNRSERQPVPCWDHREILWVWRRG